MTTEEVAVNLAKHERDIKSLGHRMDAVEDKQETLADLAASVRELANEMKHMAEEQRSQGVRLQKLESEPGERSRMLRSAIIAGVINLIVGVVAGVVVGILIH